MDDIHSFFLCDAPYEKCKPRQRSYFSKPRPKRGTSVTHSRRADAIGTVHADTFIFLYGGAPETGLERRRDRHDRNPLGDLAANQPGAADTRPCQVRKKIVEDMQDPAFHRR